MITRHLDTSIPITLSYKRCYYDCRQKIRTVYLFPMRVNSAPGTSKSMRYRIASGALPGSQAYRPSIQLPSRTATAQVHDTLFDPSRHVLVRMWTCTHTMLAIITTLHKKS